MGWVKSAKSRRGIAILAGLSIAFIAYLAMGNRNRLPLANLSQLHPQETASKSDPLTGREHNPITQGAASSAAQGPVDNSPPNDTSRLAELGDQFNRQADYSQRQVLVEQIAALRSQESSRKLLDLAAREPDVDVRVSIWNALANCSPSEDVSQSVQSAVITAYATTSELDERQSMLRAANCSATTAAFELILAVYRDESADPAERATALSCIAKQCAEHHYVLGDADLAQIEQALRTEAQAGLEASTRIECLHGVAALAGSNARPWFVTLMQKEKDPAVLRVLEELGR